jgi:outer membrane protein TolC
MLYRTITTLPFFLLFVTKTFGQVSTDGNATQSLTLKECISYALKNQPALNQAVIDEGIAYENKAIATSSWLPQVTGSAFYQHYFQLPTAFSRVNGVLNPIPTSGYYASTPQLAVTQNIFSNDALLAIKAGTLYMHIAKENTNASKIALVVDVSKAFYDILLSTERINVYREDTSRLIKNQKDAYHRYQSGIADKVDYKQATISLNNALSQLKTATEGLKGKYAYLKQLLGTPVEQQLIVSFDTAQMMQDIYVDTLAALRVEKRTEYKTLQLLKDIQRETTRYYNLGFLPTLQAYYNYNLPYQSNENPDLFSKSYPSSLLGVQLTIPIFSGLKRIDNIRKAKLQEKRIDWDEINLKLGINSQYQQAIAAYKSNLYALRSQSENDAMAKEVYNIVKLQYTEGIKAYLDVIVAETDLQTSEINYLDALFQVLQSKLDVERAMGDIVVE